jgi:hypothetical protein
MVLVGVDQGLVVVAAIPPVAAQMEQEALAQAAQVYRVLVEQVHIRQMLAHLQKMFFSV